MMLFSEQYGFREVKDVLQIKDADNNLRVNIFNVLHGWLNDVPKNAICKEVWTVLWHRPIDEFPSHNTEFQAQLKRFVLNGIWFEIYDLIQFVAEKLSDKDAEKARLYDAQSVWRPVHRPSSLSNFASNINDVLERERSGYRLVNVSVVPISNSQEMETIKESLGCQNGFEGAGVHVQKALDSFSKRPDPDYANAIKEAISAVESASQVVAGSRGDSLGKTLKNLTDRGIIHPALAKGWGSIYGFTSDAGGIRHASSDGKIEADFATAKYMLVSCSAFVNYLVDINTGRESQT